MAMSKAANQSLYKHRGYRPQSVLKKPLGEIRLKRGRMEAQGVNFNLFPEIGAAFPFILGNIVIETTMGVAARADANVPDKTGRLRESQHIRYSTARNTGAVVTGRIDYNPEDPDGSKHYYGWYVEMGTVKTKAQPFLLPALMAERSEFNRRLRDLDHYL